ncbi:MAG: hypothetical protein EP338_11775 [Bacteroidetes bacterium]|nr:MAG: hypothetical protein EP338_11775 [Bacteroidota bacterium]
MKEFKAEKLLEELHDEENIRKLPEAYLYRRVILGFDIYKYSQFPHAEQIYVPVVLEHLYQKTCQNCLDHEAFHFHKYGDRIEDFRKNFISTGDGGFQLFETPVQAIVFSLFFQANVMRFVSGSSPDPLLMKLHPIIHTFELRYAITYDHVYSYKRNFYGPAIINNARILSRDSLNRLLIDSNTVLWFIHHLNSIENLLDLDKKAFLQTAFYKDADPGQSSYLFNRKGSFISVDILKIGQIEAKTRSLDIYNLHIQAKLSLKIRKHDYQIFVTTLGNLNTSGIT